MTATISNNYAKKTNTEDDDGGGSSSLLHNKIKQSFDRLLNNEEIKELEGTKVIGSWYEQKKSDEQQPQSRKRHQTFLKIVNRIGDEVVKQVVPYYTDSIIKKIGFKTQLKEVSLSDIEIGLLDTHVDPYTEFAKLVNGVKVSSVKIKLHLEMITYIKKLTIRSTSKGLSIDIENMGIEIKLSLMGIELSSMQVPTPFSTLKEPIKIGNDKLELEHITLSPKSKTYEAIEDAKNLPTEQENNYDNVNESSSFCLNCKNRNPIGSNFCGECGSAIFKEQ